MQNNVKKYRESRVLGNLHARFGVGVRVQLLGLHHTDDEGFSAIKSAYFNNTPIAMAVLDGEGGSGLDADFSVTNFTRNEPLEEAITVNVTVKPTYVTRAPTWVDGGGS